MMRFIVKCLAIKVYLTIFHHHKVITHYQWLSPTLKKCHIKGRPPTSDTMRSTNSFSTRLLSSCTDEYAHTYDISTYSVQQWSCELGLGLWLVLGFSLRAARVHTHRVYNHATSKRHVEKRVDRIFAAGRNHKLRFIFKFQVLKAVGLGPASLHPDYAHVMPSSIAFEWPV